MLVVAQNAFLDISTLGLTALTGLDPNIETQSSSGTRETQQTEAVSWLGGDNLSLVANDSIYARGADLSADEDMLLVSGGDVIWDAAINQQTSHRYDNSEAGIGTSSEAFTRTSETTVNGVNASAGGNLTVMAGGDIQMIATDIEAGEDATVQADGSIALLSADEHYQSVSQVRGKGELGTATSLTKEELNRSVAVVSSIAANNIRISAGGDQYHAATTLSADNDIDLDAGGAIVFASVKDTEQYSIHSEGSDLLWMKVEGEGRYDETLRQAQIQAAGTLAINAAQGIRIDIKEIDQATVSETIAAMVENDPQLAWLKEMDARGDVDWQRIKEVHDAWDYESQGMGPGLALAVTIAATVLTGGVAASAGQAVAMSTNIAVTGAMGTAAGATAGAVVGGAVSAGITTAASSLAVGTINNGGRLDRALSDFTSSDSLKSTTASMLTAGITQGILDPAFEQWRFGKITTTQPESVLSITKGFDLNRLDGMLGFTAHHAMQGITSAGISAAIQGGSFSDLLKSNLESQGNNVLSALAFNQVGNLSGYMKDNANSLGQYEAWGEGGLLHTGLHGVAGGLITEATGGDFATGAAAAGLNQWLTPQLNRIAGEEGQWRPALSQFAGIAGAAIVGGDVNDGAWIAKQADTYNRQLHPEEKISAKRLSLVSEGQFTKGEIENALRALPNRALGEEAGSNILVDTQGDAFQTDFASLYFDFDGDWMALPGADGSAQYMLQVPPNNVSQELTEFIVANTGGVNSPYYVEPYVPSGFDSQAINFTGANGSPWQDAWGRAYGPHDTTVGWHFGTTQEPEILPGVYETFSEKLSAGFAFGIGAGNYYVFDDVHKMVHQYGVMDLSVPFFSTTEFGLSISGSYGFSEIDTLNSSIKVEDAQVVGSMVVGVGPTISFDASLSPESASVGAALGAAVEFGVSKPISWHRKSYTYEIFENHFHIPIPDGNKASPRRK